MLLIISGPSGVGKNRWINIATREVEARFVVPYTTRAPRADEEPGRDYHFITIAEFQERISQGLFCEWDFALGNYYGSGLELMEAAEGPQPAVIHALARMAVRLHSRAAVSRLLYLDVKEMSELGRRLRERGYSGEELESRVRHWEEEPQHRPLFDRIVADAEGLEDSAIEKLLRTEFSELSRQRTTPPPAT